MTGRQEIGDAWYSASICSMSNVGSRYIISLMSLYSAVNPWTQTNVLKSAIGDGFAHLLELSAGVSLLHEGGRQDPGLDSCWC